MSHSVTYEQFYEAIGRATGAWAMLEDRLFDLFSRLVVCSVTGKGMSDHPSAIWVLGDVFYSISNLGARLSMIDKIAPRIVTEDELLREWSAVKNKVNELYKRRNILAHGMVWGNDTPSSLAYSMFGKKEHM